jgi:hypothetical protein
MTIIVNILLMRTYAYLYVTWRRVQQFEWQIGLDFAAEIAAVQAGPQSVRDDDAVGGIAVVSRWQQCGRRQVCVFILHAQVVSIK